MNRKIKARFLSPGDVFYGLEREWIVVTLNSNLSLTNYETIGDGCFYLCAMALDDFSAHYVTQNPDYIFTYMGHFSKLYNKED